MIVVNLPWPPSMNTYWRMVNNRMLLSRAGRRYKQQVANQVAEQLCATTPLAGRVKVTIAAYPPDKRRRDLDNLLKGVLDALSGVLYVDDSQIDQLLVFREHTQKDGLLEVIVETL